MTEEKKSYVVVDRRRFDSEGEVRDTTVEEREPQRRDGPGRAPPQPSPAQARTTAERGARQGPPEAAQRASAPTPQRAPAAPPTPAPAAPRPGAPSGAAAAGAPAASSTGRGAAGTAPDLEADELDEGPPGATGIGGGPGVDFSSFVLSIATNAVMNLGGETRDGRIPGGRVNLNVAAQHIDILMMIEEKTRGNLEPEETELLGALLYDLRMQFVTVAQRHQAPPAR